MPERNGAGKGRAVGVLKRDLPVGDGQLFAQQRGCEAGRVGGRGKEIGDVQLAVGTALDLHLGHVQRDPLGQDLALQERKDSQVDEEVFGGEKFVLAVRFPDDDVIERHPDVREHLHVGAFHLHFSAKLVLGLRDQ